MGIILIKNNKGGVGKSWITLQLGAYQALTKNKKVLILTSDSQNNILNFAGIKQDTSKGGLEDMLEGKKYNITKLRINLFFLHLQGYKVKNNFSEKLKEEIKKLKSEFDYILIDGSPVMKLDDVFIEVADSIVIPTFLDSVTTNSILTMVRNVEFGKVKAVIPNRVGRSKVEKGYYDFLDSSLSKHGIYLSFPISQTAVISNLIEKGTLLWESRSKKLDFTKSIFECVWSELDDE